MCADTPGSLSAFIQAHHRQIIDAFSGFARTLMPAGASLSVRELEDHCEDLLLGIAADLAHEQTPSQELEKGEGRGTAQAIRASGRLHAEGRFQHGFRLAEVFSEFRALRASVLRLYEHSGQSDLAGIRRFNEAIDEALAESANRYGEQQRASEEALAKSQALFRTLGEAAPMIIILTDAQGRILYVSPGWTEFSGRSVDDVGSTGWWNTMHSDDRARVQGEWTAALIHARDFETEFRAIAADGTYRWLLARGRPVRDSGGTVTHWVNSAIDIHVRKEAEAAVRQQQRELQRADERKDEFLAMLAHELRNPLAPIRTGLELIRATGDSPAAVARVRSMMERQVGHIVRLVDDLLDVSRITSGKIRLQRRPVALADVVSSAIEAHRALIDRGLLEVTVELPEPSPVIDVDPTRLTQVLSNLVHNAAKFTPAHGRIAIVAASGRHGDADPPELILRVTDTGVGIRADALSRIFDLFTQGEHAAGRSSGGLGIGLALARRLVEMHGGTISAHSEGPGRGSEFVVRLPVSDMPPLADVEPDVGTVDAAVHRRVVVIDDNHDAADTLGQLIEVLGGQARIAYDGRSGIDAVREFHPDTVLLDVGMPEMDGYETCRRLRAEARERELLIIALTGWGQEQDKLRATRAGFDAHLTKPADPAALRQWLSEPPPDRRQGSC